MREPFDLQAYLAAARRLVDAELEARLPPADTRPGILHRAMRYCVFAGGKRLRPILCLAAAEAAGAPGHRALLPAIGLEALHTYTLIHDDLPCMDDDDLRRGRPTCHVAFGEANALLAADALLTLAFEWLAETPGDDGRVAAAVVREVARAAGSRGVVAGQVEDLASEGAAFTADMVDYIHRHKTAALIRASLRAGGIAAGATRTQLAALTAYGDNVGLAFQIADDILNATSTAAALGKPAGTDAARGKATYVALFGLDAARERARELVTAAVESVAGFGGDSEPLRALARYAVARSR